jgi:cellulose synthase/poly-beta-1,6-N-acetylglucosamine synthase-like glycosyltransferase
VTAAAAPLQRRRRVALVMPVRNEAAAVDETMRAVFASTRLPDEIVVADAMSTDDTVRRLEPWRGRGVPLKIVPNPTIYCGGGRNAAIRATDCEVVVIADFGNPMFPDYIEQMVRPFEADAGVEVAMGILLPLMRTSFERCMGMIYYEDNLRLRELTPEQKHALLPEVLLPGGGCIAMTRRFWERMGGYPEWLARSQDRLFSLKAYCHGARVTVAWDAYCYNHVRGDVRSVYRMAYGWARCNGQSRYLRKHLLKAVPLYALIVALLALAPISAAAPVLALALAAFYLIRSGYRRIVRVDGGIRCASYLWQAPAIIVGGDLGTIFGQAVGWFEWFSRPALRTAFRDYIRGCPPGRLHVVER